VFSSAQDTQMALRRTRYITDEITATIVYLAAKLDKPVLLEGPPGSGKTGNFEPMQQQVESWRQTQITDAQAKLIFYSAFVDGQLDAPKSLLSDVHRLYFEPEYPEFSPRTMWSLSNAFTSAFKKLDPVPQFKATAKLGAFLTQLSN
jgi:MoxR-like ATPase